MARRGSPVDETIECAGIGSGEATDRLLAVAASEYRAVNVGGARLQFARTYRPTWTIVCVICLFPIGLLFLLVRSTETWAATVEEDHRRVRVRLTGPVLAHVLVAARTALTAGPLVAPVAPSPGVVADPVSTPAASGPAAPGILAQPVAVPAPMTPPPSAASVPSWAAPVAPRPAALPHPGAWPAAPPAPAELAAPHRGRCRSAALSRTTAGRRRTGTRTGTRAGACAGAVVDPGGSPRALPTPPRSYRSRLFVWPRSCSRSTPARRCPASP